MLRCVVTYLLFLVTTTTIAQQKSVRGNVLDQQGVPLPGATILVENSVNGTTTDFNGNFTLNANIGDVIIIRYVGFIAQSIIVRESINEYLVKLVPNNDLEEVVLTGVAGRTDIKKVSFSIGKVSEVILQQVPGVDVISSIRGKIAGVNVVQGTGLPGVAPSIRVRGSSSLLGTQAPLVILDGTILDGNFSDISSDDIESIEVLKGSAAASLYGSRAATGVVQIFTKRGNHSYGSSIKIRAEIGTNYIPKNRRPTITQAHNYQLDSAGNFVRGNDGGYVLEDDRIADNPFPIYYDNISLFFSTNYTHHQSIQFLNRTERTTSNLSFTNLSQDGILNFDQYGFVRQTARLNHDIWISDNFKLSTSTGLSSNELIEPDLGATSPFYTILSTPPHADLTASNQEDNSPYNWNAQEETGWPGVETNPLYTLENESTQIRRQRVIGNYKLTYYLADYLNIEGAYSFDFSTTDIDFFVDKGWLNTQVTIYDEGYININRSKSKKNNFQLTLSFDKNLNNDLNLKAKLFYLYDYRFQNEVTAGGSKIGISGLNDLDNVVADTELIGSDVADYVEKSFATIVDLDYKDKYLASFLIRRDGNSLFGPDVREKIFYRISGAWRITKDFDIPQLQEWKIRASLGTAGLLPPFAAQYETFTLSEGTAEKNTIGNTKLGPFFSTELELGTNFQINKFITLEYNYAEKTTEGQVLPVDITVETEGFPLQWRNAGTLQSFTNELSITFNWINNPKSYLDTTFLFDSTNQYVTELFRPVWQLGPRNSFIIQAGKSYGIYLGSKILTSLEELKDNQNPSDYSINDDGYVVNQNGLPVFLLDEKGNQMQVQVGDINPDFNISFNSIFRYKNFSAFVLWDWKQGGNVYNQTKQTTFKELLHPDIDQSNKPLDQRKSTNYYSALYNINATTSHFVEDASYLKLRELNISYTLSNLNFLSRSTSIKFSLIGRNILQFDNYSGVDPEVTVRGNGDPTNFFYDGYGYPTFSTITGGLELNF